VATYDCGEAWNLGQIVAVWTHIGMFDAALLFNYFEHPDTPRPVGNMQTCRNQPHIPQVFMNPTDRDEIEVDENPEIHDCLADMFDREVIYGVTDRNVETCE
jgi:hypothetical protein